MKIFILNFNLVKTALVILLLDFFLMAHKGFAKLDFFESEIDSGISFKNEEKLELDRSVWDSDIKIEDVVFQGAQAVSVEDFKNVILSLLGSRLNHEQIFQFESQVRLFYYEKGYQQAKVNSFLVRRKKSNRIENILKLLIDEGPLISIKEIECVDSTKSLNIKKLFSYLTIQKNEPLQSSKIQKSLDEIQNYLLSLEYVGYKLSVKIISIQKDKEQNREWVRVKFLINPGRKVSFGFRGNTLFSRSHLDGLIQEQRMLGLGKDYLFSIEKAIKNEYFSLGYADVKITPYFFTDSNESSESQLAPLHVSVAIEEGKIAKIDSIRLDGNLFFEEKELLKQFFNFSSSLVKNFIYVEKDLEQAAERLMEWLKSQGYLSARLVNLQVIDLPQSVNQEHKVQVVIYISEGQQTQVDKIALDGNSIFSRSKIISFLGISEGKPLNLFAFQEGLEALKKAYLNEGYLGFKVVNYNSQESKTSDKDDDLSILKYSNKNRYATIRLKIQEGEQYLLSGVQIQGLVKTKPWIVERELNLKPGSILKESDLLEMEAVLKRTGIFSAVDLVLLDDPNRANYKVIRLILKEADRGSITYGPGYRNDLGIRLFSYFTYSNLWGENHTVSLSAAMNRRFQSYRFVEGQLQAAYSWPWFLLPKLYFRPTVAQSWTQYINFSAVTTTLAALWERELLSRPKLVSQLGYTFERIEQRYAQVASDNGHFTVAALTSKFSLDLRDHPFVPTRGFYGMVWGDLALPFLGSQGGNTSDDDPIAYYRIQGRYDYYIPLGSICVWYLSFRLGYEETISVNHAPIVFIPLIKEFALGGIASIRGYSEQEINNPSRLENGSLAYVNYRTQLDFPFVGSLKLGIFLDAGRLLLDKFSFSPDKYGVGAGLHYQTPVGPLNLDCGFKVNPPAGTSPYVINFSVGVI